MNGKPSPYVPIIGPNTFSNSSKAVENCAPL